MKHYQRNRTETLSLRLTPEEKKILKSLAAKNGVSITDYILLSALQYSAAGGLRSRAEAAGSNPFRAARTAKRKPGRCRL